MNILFYTVYEVSKNNGGVSNVTDFWYHYFQSKGHNVGIAYLKKGRNVENNVLVQFQLPKNDTIQYFVKLLKEKHIDVVINQQAVNNKTSMPCVEACRLAKVRHISVIHNTPELHIHSPHFKSLSSTKIGRDFLKYLLGIVQKSPFYKGGKYIHDNSDYVTVLSPSYIDEYCQLNVGYKSNKVVSIYNPLTFSKPEVNNTKENMVLFVGRLAPQKSLNKLLKIWQNVERNNSDWSLVLVGDGPDKEMLMNLSKTLHLSTVKFIGQSNPHPYYKKAKIFVMTSIFEGLPMTLIECQAYGVVPIVYDSFSAAKDIIDNGKNGFLIPAYDDKKYIALLNKLMNDIEMFDEMSQYARHIIDRYNPDVLYTEWLKLMTD